MHKQHPVIVQPESTMYDGRWYPTPVRSLSDGAYIDEQHLKSDHPIPNHAYNHSDTALTFYPPPDAAPLAHAQQQLHEYASSPSALAPAPRDATTTWQYVPQTPGDAFVYARESIQYDSDYGSNSDDGSGRYSITSSIPTHQSSYYSVASGPQDAPDYGQHHQHHHQHQQHHGHQQPDNLPSISSVYTPGSASPVTHVSSSHGASSSQSPLSHHTASSSSPYPSPFPSPSSNSRLTPSLTSLSIEPSHRFPSSPLSPGPPYADTSSPHHRHRRAPSSVHSGSHELLAPSDADSASLHQQQQQQQHSYQQSSSSRQHHHHSRRPVASSSSTPYPTQRTPSSSADQPKYRQAMREGTAMHPDIPRPLVVASPVPVPNLIKKSRGRQVPSVPGSSTPSTPSLSRRDPAPSLYPSAASAALLGQSVMTTSAPRTGSSSRSARPSAVGSLGDPMMMMMPGGSAAAGTAAVMVGTDAELRARPFVCTVEGCGNAYIRAEHLKRHIRSIHTNDKPYMCPTAGCGREFSRYDNLCQHVKGVHGSTSVPRNNQQQPPSVI